MPTEINSFFEHRHHFFIQQIKEWAEIITSFETTNRYQVLDESGTEIGYIAEAGSGFWALIMRTVFRSHRPMKVQIWNQEKKKLMYLQRPFFFFFSDLSIYDSAHTLFGHVYRRFSILYKKYDLCDPQGQVFARIKSPVWRLWKFPIIDNNEQEVGVISKKWGGALKEIFTDADKFQVQMPDTLTIQQKAVVFGAAISVDLDFFEQNSSSALDLLDS